MPRNFSEKKSNELSFSDLNYFIDQCTCSIQGSSEVFYLQTLEMNKNFFDTCKNQKELEFLHKKLMLANCFQIKLDTAIEMITVAGKQVEYEVMNLENDIFHPHNCCKGVALDIFRINTYELAERINTKLSNIEEMFDQIDNTYSSTEKSSLNTITLTLTTLLKQLEIIEIEIFKLRDTLNHVTSNQQAVLQLLHLRTSKII